MSLGGTLYQLALALVIGIVGGSGKTFLHPQVAAFCAKASFALGAAWMLFSSQRWWPVTLSVIALVTWTISGWLAAWLGYWLACRVRKL